jgi:hypothetical protein
METNSNLSVSDEVKASVNKKSFFVVGLYAFGFYILSRLVGVGLQYLLQNLFPVAYAGSLLPKVVIVFSWVLLFLGAWFGVRLGVLKLKQGGGEGKALSSWVYILLVEVGVLTGLILLGFGLYVALTFGASSQIINVFFDKFFSMYLYTVLSLLGVYAFQLGWCYKYLEPENVNGFWVSMVVSLLLVVTWVFWIGNLVRGFFA